MEAKILSNVHQPGSKPSDSWQLWQDLDPLISGTPYYVRGHLLNENLGGKGQIYNLTPITTKANADHKTMFEKYIKKWVINKGRVANYRVSAVYGGEKKKSDRQKTLEKKKKDGTISLSPKEAKELAALTAERKLASKFVIKAYVMKQTKGKWEEDTNAKKSDPDFSPLSDSVQNKGTAGE
jgi:hypothetical protein